MVADIFEKKESVNAFPLKAFYNLNSSVNDESTCKFGVSVPKKKFKRAVDRNHIKRLVKESIRLNKTLLEQSLYKNKQSIHVMIVCYFEEIPEHSFVEEKINKILDRLAKRLNSDE